MKKTKKKILSYLLAWVMLIGITASSGIVAKASNDVVSGVTYSGQTKKGSPLTYNLKLSISSKISMVGFAESQITVRIYDGDAMIFEEYHGNDFTDCTYLDRGNYLIVIESTSSSRNPNIRINFKWSSVKDTFDYSNDYITDVTTRTPIPFGTKIYGTVTAGEDSDYFRIQVPKNGKITIDISDNNMGGGHYLYNSNGDKTYLGSGNHRISKTYNVKKGNYYLKIGRYYTGTYCFKVTYNKSATNTFSLKKKTNKSFQIKTGKTGATSGYQIKYRPGSGKWKTIVVKKTTLNKTLKKLKKNKTYQVKIRTYYTYKGKNLYSDWGKLKKIKLK